MDCDRCGDYIEEFAVCPDCVTELEQQIKRTPLELAAGDLLKAAEFALRILLQSQDCYEDYAQRTINDLSLAIQKVKTLNNPSPQANPLGSDAHKFSP
jgi:hypothetical protein